MSVESEAYADLSMENAELKAEREQLREALKLAAMALDIADDCGFHNVQANPPPEWGLEACGEDPADGWCSPSELARKLRELARGRADVNRSM